MAFSVFFEKTTKQFLSITIQWTPTSDGTRAQIPCPEAIRLYNRFMGGVDTFDVLRRAYSCSRKSNKWWMQIHYLLDTTITSAYTIYNTTPHTKKLTHIEFFLAVAQHLISCHNSRKRPAVSQAPPAACLQGRHFPSKNVDKLQCHVCTERRRTIYCCSDCCTEVPIPLCPTPCFRIYHTRQNIAKK